MNKFIQPKILQGTRDFLPEEMAKREYVMNVIKSVFVNFGYDAIETPAIEYAKTILGKYGDEASKLIYRFKDNGRRDIALRYDQTVPFARLVAANYKKLPMPFKRYEINRVWRADRPAKGRYREFYQCDVDIIGTENLLGEAEIVAVMGSVFSKLGFTGFSIKFNSRRLMNSILTDLRVPAEIQALVIRILDKLDKRGVEGVRDELASFMSKPNAEELLSILMLGDKTNEEKLNALAHYDVGELRRLMDLARSFGATERLVFDPSLARGLDYYTGVIFEAFVNNMNIGAICAGGRYDDLCSLFSPERLSGVGVAFGFDRIMVAMEELGLLNEVALNARVLVAYFDNATLSAALDVLRSIQEAGISAEIYFEPAKIAKQMKYANRKKIPFFVICGPEELSRGEVTIKMMKTGKQKNIPEDQVANYFKGYNVS